MSSLESLRASRDTHISGALAILQDALVQGEVSLRGGSAQSVSASINCPVRTPLTASLRSQL